MQISEKQRWDNLRLDWDTLSLSPSPLWVSLSICFFYPYAISFAGTTNSQSKSLQNLPQSSYRCCSHFYIFLGFRSFWWFKQLSSSAKLPDLGQIHHWFTRFFASIDRSKCKSLGSQLMCKLLLVFPQIADLYIWNLYATTFSECK